LRKSCADEGYAQELARYRHIHVRVALKAETAEGFQERAGAGGEFWELPFLAISRLLEARVSFHVAALTDPRLMLAAERRSLLRRLRETGYQGYLEEEICNPYRTSLVRLKEAGYEVFWRKVA